MATKHRLVLLVQCQHYHQEAKEMVAAKSNKLANCDHLTDFETGSVVALVRLIPHGGGFTYYLTGTLLRNLDRWDAPEEAEDAGSQVPKKGDNCYVAVTSAVLTYVRGDNSAPPSVNAAKLFYRMLRIYVSYDLESLNCDVLINSLRSGNPAWLMWTTP